MKKNEHVAMCLWLKKLLVCAGLRRLMRCVVPLRSGFLGVASAGRKSHMVPRGLEPRALWLLAVRSNQLSYEAP